MNEFDNNNYNNQDYNSYNNYNNGYNGYNNNYNNDNNGYMDEQYVNNEPVQANVEIPYVNSEPVRQETIKINLSGNADNVYQESVYTENVRHKKVKKEKSGKRMVAAMVALTVLNLAIFGGTYFLGRSSGISSSNVASKQELVSSLQGDGQGAETAETANRGPELSTVDIAKQVGPAVVGITSVIDGQMSIFGNPMQSNSQGSGIILSGDGYIVTNNHVVSDSSAVKVTLNTGQEYDAKVIGLDAQTDLAVVKIEPKEALTVAKLGDSSAIEVGERVVAIGNPMGLEFFGSVTQGIVSAVNRSITIENRTMNLIQTDAAINSGNSGGALINAYGEVIGINSVKVTTTGVEGMGFAIPITEASPIISDLLEFGYVKGRPLIGISTRDVDEYMSQAYSWPQGVQVMNVSSESAKSAGLEQGDIITSVNGQAVKSGGELNKIKDQHKPGDVLTLEVYKYSTGLNATVSVTLSEQLPG